MRWTLAGVLLVAAAVIAPDLRAQRRGARDGFWLGAGLGGGWARVSCSICRGRHEPGTTGFLRLGGSTSRRLRLGGELAAWVGGDAEVDENTWSLSAAAYWYPQRRRRLYLKGGVGYTTHHAEDGTNVVSSTGFGPQFGIGYDFPLNGNWFLAPFFNATFGAVGGAVKFNGAKVQDTANLTLVQVGLSVLR